MNKLKRQKAQAAITDALFFLTIIIVLTVMLFKYSASYGDRVDLAINNLYFKEYSNSALKTIFYSEIPLDYNKNIFESEEIDYLMTAVKTDFYPDKHIGSGDLNYMFNPIDEDIPNPDVSNPDDIAKYNLFHTIKSVMMPLPSYDFTFYLYNTNDQKFEYIMLKITDFENSENDSNKTYKLNDINMGLSKYYLCDPLNYNDIREVISKANDIHASSVPLTFTAKEGRDETELEITSTFAIWPANKSIAQKELEKLNCKIYND
ncbi:MAG: hypothetical protein PHR26_02190 [Candidatus ainarchaeum sp.]|nr:hypothetical protein [Candidatus ainarchaeum sp.]MDD3976198.1 hypothetical protein [Candidatus ainarchaeum sp.]